MVRFFWGPFSLFLILKGTCSFGWFTVAIQVSSLKSARSLISRKKFCWFLLYIFEVGMKLRFLFRSLYVSKENECFDKFTTFPDGSDLYLSAFVIVRCSLKVFALFLVRNSVPLTDRCWFQYGLLRWKLSWIRFFVITRTWIYLKVQVNYPSIILWKKTQFWSANDSRPKGSIILDHYKYNKTIGLPLTLSRKSWLTM